MSRHRQNFGAVGQVTRAMVVALPSCRIVMARRSAEESGVAQVAQSDVPSSKPHAPRSAADCACWTVSVIRVVNSASSTLPSVATEMV